MSISAAHMALSGARGHVSSNTVQQQPTGQPAVLYPNEIGVFVIIALAVVVLLSPFLFFFPGIKGKQKKEEWTKSPPLPSYIDDVHSYATFEDLPAMGEDGKVYITTEMNEIYRWDGSRYIQVISPPPVDPFETCICDPKDAEFMVIEDKPNYPRVFYCPNYSAAYQLYVAVRNETDMYFQDAWVTVVEIRNRKQYLGSPEERWVEDGNAE